MKELVIIADAGGTKTEWCLFLKGFSCNVLFKTGGINISVNSAEQIESQLSLLKEEIERQYDLSTIGGFTIHFYGAGCNSSDSKNKLKFLFKKYLGDKIRTIQCDSDLLGAAKALFGKEEGIACILGTGSASCKYDGMEIVDSIPSLGFILGDEGSGAFMGKRLLNKYFKRELSDECMNLLRLDKEISIPIVIEKVYRECYPNKYLASFFPFIEKNKNFKEISSLVDESLKLFIETNVLKYKGFKGSRIRFVGGVACSLSDRIQKICEDYDMIADCFLDRPIVKLADYYIETYQ